MRVLHVIPSLAPRDGGPSTALPLMARALERVECAVTIATTAETSAVEVPHGSLPGQPVSGPGGTYFFFPRQTNFYKFSWPLTRWLGTHVRDFDLVHIHGLFSYGSVAAAWIARRHFVPYVVRPLGVLNRWGLENRRRRIKRSSLRWVEMPILRHAAAIQYTSGQEQQQAAEAGHGIGDLPSVVIPLGIDTAAYTHPPDLASFFTRFPKAVGRKLILFLSRVDQKKGLDLLLDAFAQMHQRCPQSLLVVAGDGPASCISALHAQAESLGIAEQVLWTGFLAGVEKNAALAAASMFVLPSYSENFGIAAAEALAAGVPSVLSDQVAIAEESGAAEAAIVVPCEVAALATALERLATEPQTCVRISANARALASRRFSLDAAGALLLQLYQSILQKPRTAVLCASAARD